MPIAKLRIVNTEFSGREFVLPPHPAIIGRSGTSDIVIPDQSVSRQHVRGEVRDGHCVLTDLGSHNGIVVSGTTLREAVVPSGGRFELGDVLFEFVVEQEEAPTTAPAAAPPALAAEEDYALVEPGLPPSERPVYVDDVFGPAVMVEEPGPGEEEEAAVAGARGAARYIVVVAVILAIGIVAWHMAGGGPAEPAVKPVIVKAGERKVIDLGLGTLTSRGRLVTYVNETEVYRSFVYEDPRGEDIALFELDPTGFMATVEGVDLGETDVKVYGQRGRKAIVRILVRGIVPRPPGEEELTPQQRLAKASLLIAGGEAALTRGDQHLYQAMKQFKDAHIVLDPIQDAEGAAEYRRAYDLYVETQAELNERFEGIKAKVMIHYKDRDTRSAAKAMEKLRHLVPDENDERNQQLAIIFQRMLRKMRRGG